MLKKIIGTLGTRIIIAGLTLIVVLMNARVLGKDNLGLIVQIVLAITIIQLISNVIGGPALVYMVPRFRLMKLLFPSWIWAIIVSLAGVPVLAMFAATRADQFMTDVFFLSVIFSLLTVNLMVLMGKEKIKEYNTATVIQAVVLLMVLITEYFTIGLRTVNAYVIALYFSYGSGFLISFLMILPDIRKAENVENESGVLKEMFRYGGTMQVANIFQFLNYRLSYIFIVNFLGRGPLGIFSLGNSLSESLWLLARSVSTVQYSRISNENDPHYAARLTLTFIKLCFILTFLGMIILIGLLFLFFDLIIPPDFEPVKTVMLILAPGIIAFSVSVILSPYFSGLGKPVHNTVTSGVGLVCTMVLGFILIPKMGITGAAITATVSYSVATSYQLVVFMKLSGLRLKDFLLRRSEILTAYAFFISLPGKK